MKYTTTQQALQEYFGLILGESGLMHVFQQLVLMGHKETIQHLLLLHMKFQEVWEFLYYEWYTGSAGSPRRHNCLVHILTSVER